MMKLHCSDVVKMASEGEEALPLLVVPNFDFVVISSGYEERLRLVKVDSPDRSFMFFKLVDDRFHGVINELNSSGVQ